MVFGTNGIGLGASLGVSATIGDWGFVASYGFTNNGVDNLFSEKSVHRLGFGFSYDDGRFGISHYATRFMGSTSSQRVAGLGLGFDKFHLNYENDYLGVKSLQFVVIV